MPASVNGINNARLHKNDEFYTKLEDVEKELKHYHSFFKDKIIYCNTDRKYESNFITYFMLNADEIGWKKLLASNYSPGSYGKKSTIENRPEGLLCEDNYMTFDGDFRGFEAMQMMKECDVVVTNPPFSLFRNLVKRLVDRNKFFLLMGNTNAVTYKEIFPLIKANKMWLGVNSHKSTEFMVPKDMKFTGTANRIDENGNKFITVQAISWFTNIPHGNTREFIHLNKKYNEADYPKYDNYDAIEVGKVRDIPVDYAGIMGVPITFLCRYNPEQFEIVGMSGMDSGQVPELKRTTINNFNCLLNGKDIYRRVFIRNKKLYQNERNK